ncbi:amidase, partial [Mesorhizobium sp. M7A.F.Ca.US.006.01.1.1]|uniref:amidase n=1 Tax=Mesorhizobium sp. M7A.F.Ca.US.006.01.1.1 TaxID=2496707 RepID=UPI000FD48E10
PTTCHSALLLDEVATEDAHVVKLLRGAGAIILGKVATHEFAMGGPSFDLPFPPARNPWSRDHNPGGSSSGSGAGVAAELFPLALGTDTLGSVRHPAAACGIVGLKPTYGLVSRGGVFPLAQTLDHVGPMARTVKDAALLLDVIAGYDPLDPGSSEKRGSISYTRNLDDDIRSVRIGFIRHFHESDMICDPEVGDALENAAKVLVAEGASVESVTLPPLSDFASAAGVIIHSEAWSVHAKWMRERPQSYGQLSRKRFLTGAFFPAEALVAAQRVRLRMISMVEEALSQFDVLLCANLMDPPPRIDDEAELAYKHPRQARAPFNLTGHPAISMMSGLSQSGLPLSLQFVGRYFDEARLLGVAAAFERTTSWHTLRPPLIS